MWATSDYLAEFIAENNIISILLNPDTTHIELIRRSFPFLKLMLEKEKAGEKELMMLWELAATEQHESQAVKVLLFVWKV